jgi:hypothetical protein
MEWDDINDYSAITAALLDPCAFDSGTCTDLIPLANNSAFPTSASVGTLDHLPSMPLCLGILFDPSC